MSHYSYSETLQDIIVILIGDTFAVFTIFATVAVTFIVSLISPLPSLSPPSRIYSFAIGAVLIILIDEALDGMHREVVNGGIEMRKDLRELDLPRVLPTHFTFDDGHHSLDRLEIRVVRQ